MGALCLVPCQVAAIAASTGGWCAVVSDVGGTDTDFPESLLRDSTYVCPNETELERISGGLPTTNEEEIKEAVKSLQRRGAQNVLVTLGKEGSMLEMRDGQSFRLNSVPPPGGKVVDTTGAGDVFRAAFAVGLALKLPMKEALTRAAAASSICITKMGTIPAMPVATDVDDLLQEAGGNDNNSGATKKASM